MWTKHCSLLWNNSLCSLGLGKTTCLGNGPCRDNVTMTKEIQNQFSEALYLLPWLGTQSVTIQMIIYMAINSFISQLHTQTRTTLTSTWPGYKYAEVWCRHHMTRLHIRVMQTCIPVLLPDQYNRYSSKQRIANQNDGVKWTEATRQHKWHRETALFAVIALLCV